MERMFLFFFLALALLLRPGHSGASAPPLDSCPLFELVDLELELSKKRLALTERVALSDELDSREKKEFSQYNREIKKALLGALAFGGGYAVAKLFQQHFHIIPENRLIKKFAAQEGLDPFKFDPEQYKKWAEEIEKFGNKNHKAMNSLLQTLTHAPEQKQLIKKHVKIHSNALGNAFGARKRLKDAIKHQQPLKRSYLDILQKYAQKVGVKQLTKFLGVGLQVATPTAVALQVAGHAVKLTFMGNHSPKAIMANRIIDKPIAAATNFDPNSPYSAKQICAELSSSDNGNIVRHAFLARVAIVLNELDSVETFLALEDGPFSKEFVPLFLETHNSLHNRDRFHYPKNRHERQGHFRSAVGL